ncbi:superoxide dismutase [Chryseotalea sanaruensis]|nr:superoxide dismutase [Chryseotalea sanaruensis]
MKTTRRKFIETSAKAGLLSALGAPLFFSQTAACASIKMVNESKENFAFAQDPLPYNFEDLEPYIDKQTMEIHYTKHHAAYVKNVNDAIAAEGIVADSNNDFFSSTSRYSTKARNNGGGAWNHNFFWNSMNAANKVSIPSGKLTEVLNSNFGSIEKFKEQFTQAAMTRFGSGWAWLVEQDGKLMIGSTPNQDNPLMDVSEFKGRPLLALDVWEHAYYLKYQNKRNEYVSNWWSVVNWNEVTKRLG